MRLHENDGSGIEISFYWIVCSLCEIRCTCTLDRYGILVAAISLLACARPALTCVFLDGFISAVRTKTALEGQVFGETPVLGTLSSAIRASLPLPAMMQALDVLQWRSVKIW